MPHNPHRSKALARKRQRAAAVSAGTKHSDIMKRRKIGRNAPATDQIKTNHGFKKFVFSCKAFTQTFECLYAGNNTGFGVNHTGDRIIKVERGTVYVTTADVEKSTNVQTNKDIRKFGEGAFINLTRGTGYSLATVGNIDVELLITETTGYDKKWILLDETSVVEKIDEEAFVPPPQSTKTRREGRNSNKAREYAERLAAKRNRKSRPGAQPVQERVKAPTRVSAAVPGVNPPLLNFAAMADD